MNQKKQTRPGIQKTEKNKIEWAVFAVSALLLILLMSYLVYQTFTHRPSTPDIAVRYEKDPSPSCPNRYRIFVENKGGETAEDVMIEAVIMSAGLPVETAGLQVAFSPKWSHREGWVNFSRSAGEGDSLSVKVVSYKKP